MRLKSRFEISGVYVTVSSEDAVITAQREPAIEIHAELTVEATLGQVQFGRVEIRESSEGILSRDIVLLREGDSAKTSNGDE